MSDKRPEAANPPCMCSCLRQASRAVTRLYDDELRTVGIRTTQYTLLRVVSRLREVRQGALESLIHIDQTTLTRNLRPLVNAGWLAVRKGEDQREKLVSITKAGEAKLAKAHPAWERAQNRMQALLPKDMWKTLFEILPVAATRAAER